MSFLRLTSKKQNQQTLELRNNDDDELEEVVDGGGDCHLEKEALEKIDHFIEELEEELSCIERSKQ